MKESRPLVIGTGNPLAGDDAAGRMVACLLATQAVNFDVAEATGNVAELITLFEGRERVLIVDACHSRAMPGTLQHFDAGDGPLPAYIDHLSSHGLGLAAAIELARALKQLPLSCTVYAIEGASFDLGAEVSAPVADAASRLAAIICAEFTQQRCSGPDMLRETHAAPMTNSVPDRQ